MLSVDEIYEEIKREIINLDLAPGSKVTESFLTYKFHISRTPIRSVISRLEKDNLVVVTPKKGTYVSKITLENVSDYMKLRVIVETHVLREVCKTITQQQIEELKNIIEEQSKIIAMEPSIEKSKMFFHNDNLFHSTIFKFGNSLGLWKIIHSNAITLNRVRIMANLRETTQVENIYEQHYAMIKCLEKHDEERLVSIFTTHIDDGLEGISSVVNKYHDYFM